MNYNDFISQPAFFALCAFTVGVWPWQGISQDDGRLNNTGSQRCDFHSSVQYIFSAYRPLAALVQSLIKK